MQYSFVKACLLALAATSSVLAQTVGFNVITAPTSGEVLVPGTTYSIKWTPSEPAGPVSLILMQGATNTTLQLGATIAAGIQSSVGKFDWAIPADAGSFAAYGIKLQLDSAPATTFQFSNPFVIRAAAGTTKTVQLSQVSTLASTSTSSTLSSSSTISSTSTSTSAPVTTSSTSTSTSAPPSSTFTSSTIVPFQNSTTLVPTTIAPTTVATTSPSASASPTVVKTGGAVSNAVRGTGLLGALAVSFFMLL